MQSGNVMIVDDSNVDRKLIKTIIESLSDSIKVYESEDANHIVQKIKENNISVLILDLVLNHYDGLEVLIELKNDVHLRDIPVIIFSSISDPAVIKNALSLGAYDYFEKPLTVNDIKFALGLKVNNALRMKQNTDHIKFLNNHDTLTSLYSRSYMESFIKKEYDQDPVLALAILDINGLKVINDAYGYKHGESLIIEISRQLSILEEEIFCIARWGSDEFAILFKDMDKASVKYIVESIITKLHASVEYDFELSYGIEVQDKKEMHVWDFIKGAEDHLIGNKITSTSSYRSDMIKSIANTLHQKNPREELHSKRVSELCGLIAKQLNFSEFEIKKAILAGHMHDIGKIVINEAIINKSGKLDEYEWKIIRSHPEIGFRILTSSKDTMEIANAVLGHHERWDGTGYPQNIKGEEISLLSRIICVADSFDAMTAYRTYKTAMTQEEAINEILACSGTQFDPMVVDAFVIIMKNIHLD